MDTVESFLQYLRCPRCRHRLHKNEHALICGACATSYQIKQGIPVLVDLNTLSPHEQSQVHYFEQETSMRKITSEVMPWQHSYQKRFSTYFQPQPGSLMIDCGTGSGYMALELARHHHQVIACDLTLSSLIALQKKAVALNLSHTIHCVCCSAEILPFADECADFFISNAVLEHLPNESAAIQAMSRVTKPKAGVMITVPLSYRYLNPIWLPLNWLHDQRIGHLRRYDEVSLVEKLKDWKLIAVEFTGHFGKVCKTLISLIYPIFDPEKIEANDQRLVTKKFGASNVIAFFTKT